MSSKGWWGRVRKEALRRHSRMLVGGDGVGDDASSDSHVGLAVVQDEGADGDAEGGGAVGGDVADGSGVDAAGMGFEFADDLHGADLGGSGDGAAGEHGAEDLVEAGAGAEGGGDGGGHLQEGLVALDGEEVVDVDGPWETDAAEIVAEEVDDHDVLGAIFFVALESEGGELRLRRRRGRGAWCPSWGGW